MKKYLLACACVFSGVSASFGALDFSEDFNSYVNGNLAGTTQNELGQGPWAQNNVSSTTPIQVSNGRAQLGTSGQDVYAAFSSPVANADGTSFYYALTLNVISAQAAGDYFFHVSNPAGSTTSFYERLFARSSGAGFQLGFVDTSTGSTITWGSAELSLSTDYRIVVGQNFIAGGNNDTFALYVNPTDPTTEANNTAYLTHTWTSTSAETATYAAVNLRQGSAANAAAVLVDDILVSKTFADVTAVPEPSSFAIAALGGFAFLGYLRRRK
jgi:hypothetical protein